MADFIDREALTKRLTRNLNACNPGTFSESCYADAIETVKHFPAADVAPVVHGRWEHLGGDEWFCSVCGFVITTEGSWDNPARKYCEECGAKMDGGAEDAAD